MPSESPQKIQVEYIRELGPLKSNLTNISARDVGASGTIGKYVLWTFGDTIFSGTYDGIPRSATAALSSIGVFSNSVYEVPKADGSPYQLIPYTSQELQALATDKEKRIALWPHRPLAVTDSSGVIFFSRYNVGPGPFDYENQGVSVAFVREGQIVAERSFEGLLFTPGEPHMIGTMVYGNYIYLYGKPINRDGLIVGRVRKDRPHDRSAYRFWDGIRWVTDISKSQDMGQGKNLPGASSWNIYLQKFISVEIGMGNEFNIYLSDSPQGPWVEVVKFTNPSEAGKGFFNYAAYEHPEYSLESGRKLIITYYHPEDQLKGSIRSLEVTLKK